MAGNYPNLIDKSRFLIVVFLATMPLLGCLKTAPEIPALSSTTGDSTGTTPAPIDTTPKSVLISWTASKALGVPAGGYRVYAKLNQVPTTGNTTPVTIVNVAGLHTTSTTMSLAPGRYYISVSAYSADAASPLSSPYILTVP